MKTQAGRDFTEMAYEGMRSVDFRPYAKAARNAEGKSPLYVPQEENSRLYLHHGGFHVFSNEEECAYLATKELIRFVHDQPQEFMVINLNNMIPGPEETTKKETLKMFADLKIRVIKQGEEMEDFAGKTLLEIMRENSAGGMERNMIVLKNDDDGGKAADWCDWKKSEEKWNPQNKEGEFGSNEDKMNKFVDNPEDSDLDVPIRKLADPKLDKRYSNYNENGAIYRGNSVSGSPQFLGATSTFDKNAKDPWKYFKAFWGYLQRDDYRVRVLGKDGLFQQNFCNGFFGITKFSFQWSQNTFDYLSGGSVLQNNEESGINQALLEDFLKPTHEENAKEELPENRSYPIRNILRIDNLVSGGKEVFEHMRNVQAQSAYYQPLLKHLQEQKDEKRKRRAEALAKKQGRLARQDWCDSQEDEKEKSLQEVMEQKFTELWRRDNLGEAPGHVLLTGDHNLLSRTAAAAMADWFGLATDDARLLILRSCLKDALLEMQSGPARKKPKQRFWTDQKKGNWLGLIKYIQFFWSRYQTASFDLNSAQRMRRAAFTMHSRLVEEDRAFSALKDEVKGLEQAYAEAETAKQRSDKLWKAMDFKTGLKDTLDEQLRRELLAGLPVFDRIFKIIGEAGIKMDIIKEDEHKARDAILNTARKLVEKHFGGLEEGSDELVKQLLEHAWEDWFAQRDFKNSPPTFGITKQNCKELFEAFQTKLRQSKWFQNVEQRRRTHGETMLMLLNAKTARGYAILETKMLQKRDKQRQRQQEMRKKAWGTDLGNKLQVRLGDVHEPTDEEVATTALELLETHFESGSRAEEEATFAEECVKRALEWFHAWGKHRWYYKKPSTSYFSSEDKPDYVLLGKFIEQEWKEHLLDSKSVPLSVVSKTESDGGVLEKQDLLLLVVEKDGEGKSEEGRKNAQRRGLDEEYEEDDDEDDEEQDSAKKEPQKRGRGKKRIFLNRERKPFGHVDEEEDEDDEEENEY